MMLVAGCGPNTPEEISPNDGGTGEKKICTGQKDCPCYPNNTCNNGLVCEKKVCIPTKEIVDVEIVDSGTVEEVSILDTKTKEKQPREFCDPGTAA